MEPKELYIDDIDNKREEKAREMDTTIYLTSKNFDELAPNSPISLKTVFNTSYVPERHKYIGYRRLRYVLIDDIIYAYIKKSENDKSPRREKNIKNNNKVVDYFKKLKKKLEKNEYDTSYKP